MKTILTGVLFLCLSLQVGTVFADPVTVHAVKKEAVEVAKVNNKICPVCGDEIGMSKDEEAATVEYEGKVYNLCGTHCIEDFNKDPKKYVQIVEDEMKNPSTEAENADHTDHDHSKEDHSKEDHSDHDHSNSSKE